MDILEVEFPEEACVHLCVSVCVSYTQNLGTLMVSGYWGKVPMRQAGTWGCEVENFERKDQPWVWWGRAAGHSKLTEFPSDHLCASTWELVTVIFGPCWGRYPLCYGSSAIY